MLNSCFNNNLNKNREIEVLERFDDFNNSGMRDGIKYILLHHSDIPDLNKWMLVSRGLNLFINQEIWPQIAKNIIIEKSPLNNKNQIKDFVISIKKIAQAETTKDWVFFATTMRTRVDYLCKSSSLNNIRLLNSVATARNMITIVNVLERLVPNAPKLEKMDFNDFAPDELAGAIEKCIKWCSDNQEALKGLESLDFSGKKLTLLPVEILKFLPKVKNLNLSNNQLSSTSEIASLWPDLQILDLSFNCVTSFNGLDNLLKLEQLNLAKNGLTSIPIEICGLHNLRDLDLRRNWITSIPLQISQLINLTGLNLTFNRITSLPTTIIELKRLALFDLSGNATWISVPDGFWESYTAQITWGLRDSVRVASSIAEIMLKVALKQQEMKYEDTYHF